MEIPSEKFDSLFFLNKWQIWRMLNCSEKCPELSGYFYSVQNLLLLYFISKVPFLPYWRVEIQKMCFCTWEECFALGIESTGVTCVPLSPYQSVVYCHGGRIGFFQGDIRLLSDDMKALRPTIFPVVPRLLNRMYDKVSWILILLFLEPWSSCPFTMWKNSLSYGDFSSRLYYFLPCCRHILTLRNGCSSFSV